MDCIYSMLVDILPCHLVKMVKSNKGEVDLRAEIDGYIEECAANSKVVYLLWIDRVSAYMAELTKLRLNAYYIILAGGTMFITHPGIERSALTLQIKKILGASSKTGSPQYKCNMCGSTGSSYLTMCHCGYRKCIGCLARHALQPGCKEIVCPNCGATQSIDPNHTH